MPRVQIITERISSLSYRFAKSEGIHIFPANIIVGDKVFKDDDDVKSKKLLIKLESMKDIPSTAVPSFGEMEQYFRQAVKDANEAIYISATSKLSGLYNLGLKVAEKLNKEGKDIRVFDSEAVVSAEGMYVYIANSLSKQGKNLEEIISVLEEIRQEGRIKIYGIIETLRFLEKNGRIGKAKAWVANLFSFKPVLSIHEGILEPIGRVRTQTQGIELVKSKIKDDLARLNANKITVMYDYGISDELIRNSLDAELKREFKIKQVFYNQISVLLACHLGPRITGITLYYE